MGRIYERIDDHQQAWIAKQSMFFVGTAPSGEDGHVNVSPKGPIGTLRVLDDHTVAYLDIVGSGAETIAHIRENGRIIVMLCAFQGPPRIVRLHGRGEIVYPVDPRYATLLDGFERPEHPQRADRALRRDVDVAFVIRGRADEEHRLLGDPCLLVVVDAFVDLAHCFQP